MASYESSSIKKKKKKNPHCTFSRKRLLTYRKEKCFFQYHFCLNCYFALLCRNNEQDMFNIIGSMFLPIIFFSLNNCTTIIPILAAERTVMYQEMYAGMYSSWAYSFAQVSTDQTRMKY